jgi:hypothetical protein
MDSLSIYCLTKEHDSKKVVGKSLEHRALKLTLSPNDPLTIKTILNAYDFASRTNFNAADSSGAPRDKSEVLIKSLMGMVAESVCLQVLQFFNTDENVTITKTESTTSVDQIDLMINKKWKDSESLISKDYKVEIRSSFPIKRVLDSVCVDFDILGRYFNDVKPDECLKDYYLRVLFEIDYDKSLIVKDKKIQKQITQGHRQTIYSKTTSQMILD